LRVGTFNLYNPRHHADTVFVRWGKTLGSKSEVLLLTEVPDQRRAELLANAAGMPYAVTDGPAGIAITSRAPIRNVQKQVINPGTSAITNSYILSAISDIGGYPHQFIATHWSRDRDDPNGAAGSSPYRIRAAQSILDLILPTQDIAVVGGDLNAFSGFGPQDHDGNAQTPDFVGSTTEVDWLYSRLTDPFVVLQKQNDDYCSNSRIDYVLIKGPYLPVMYEACFPEDDPSDHPFVLVTFEAGD
jgi:endonuclease/exonuclease/phosphatase (EEP) superfamily protein YafD